MAKYKFLGALALFSPAVLAQSCIPLSTSTTCSAFNTSSISTNTTLVGLFPFLAYVTSTESFDTQLSQYVSQQYVSTKFTNIFGCDNVNLGNTSSYYARYTTSFLCNAIIQNSKDACDLSADQLTPLCADACADMAISEEQIVSNDALCSGRNDDYADELRADFTNCALPANSISGSCIQGELNEPVDCGFGGNLMGLCNFCRGSTENATDSCCLTSNSTGRCEDVTLPVFSTLSNLLPSTASATSSSTGSASTGAATSGGGSGLSGGQIAGIVVGSVLGFLLILALIILAIACFRRRHNRSNAGSLLNQPSPQRKGVASSSYSQPMTQPTHEGLLPGQRVARMSALQDEQQPSGAPQIAPRNYTSHTDPYGDSPESNEKAIGVGAVKIGGSPGSGSQQGSSPGSGGDFSSPEGVASGQSEQLPFFKDYYSNDDIHPGDKVSVLWAYQPRAGDEFELERGDMLKVVGIWDDGWATGVRINDRAEDYDGKHKLQRDSGVSNGTATREDSPTPPGEIKAFPLVCVCLPEAWKKTVEGDTSTESGSGGPPLM